MAEKELKRVSSLKITFLVDNCIEWMTKFPPGFTTELVNQLSHDPPIDEEVTGVPFVDLENYCCGAHGFSALIETSQDGSDTHTSLFDTGPDSRSIIRNVEAMKTDVTSIERVILSHWHSDHSGGLLALLNYRKKQLAQKTESVDKLIVVDVHPSRPIARGICPPTVGRVIGRLPADPSFEQIEKLGGIVEKSAEGHVVAGGTVYVSGEIPRLTDFEAGLPGGVRWIEGAWKKEEHIMDERYALIDVIGKGLVIFSACSHAGIVNVIRDAVSRFARPVYMVIGGLHLAGPELAPRIEPTVEFLSRTLRPACTYVLPMHCTGFAAKVALEKAFGEGCVPAGVGIVVNIKGDKDGEAMIRPPTIHAK